VFRDFPTFSRICIFFLLTLSLLLFFLLIFLFSLPLPCFAFQLSILSEVWLLNVLRIVFNHIRHYTYFIVHMCSRLCIQCMLYIYTDAYELQPKFTVMESSIHGISIFGNWAEAWKTTIHSSKTDDICLCLILVINHPLSYCAGYSMPLCRHSIAFSICLRDRQTAKSCFEQVVPGDVHCCVAMVCLCCCLRCMLSTFQVLVLYGHISVFCLNSC